MVKAVLLDFWGTLMENGVESPIKQVKAILHINIPFTDYVMRMEKAMMTMKFKSLREAFESVAQEFQVDYNEEQLQELIGMWNKSWMLAQPYDDVEEMLKKLKENYQLVLVSNTDAFSVNQVLEKYGLTHFFDRIFLSCDVGLLKTDRNFYPFILRDLSLQLEDCVMIGDSIQSDIIPAKKFGMQVVLIDRKNRRDFQPKINSLRELEITLRK